MALPRIQGAPLPQGGKNAPPHWNVRESPLAVNGSTVTLPRYLHASNYHKAEMQAAKGTTGPYERLWASHSLRATN